MIDNSITIRSKSETSMVLLHLITESVEQATEVAEVLTKEKLVLHALIQPGMMGVKGDEDLEHSRAERTLVMAQTKGLLFDKIDRVLRARYERNMPVVYSVPIVNMDWEQADKLMTQTEKI